MDSTIARHSMSVPDDSEIFRSALESMQTGICVVDLNRKVLLWNDGAERITGYLRHEMVGHSFADNLQQHCGHMKCADCQERCPLVAAIHTAHPVEANGFIHHKAGHRMPIHIWAVPVRDERGIIIGAAQSFDHFRALAAGAADRRDRDHSWLDEQTGVANHATVTVHVREALRAFLDTQVPVSLLCVRLDDFEEIGMKYGKDAAVSMLRVVAQTLENALRPTDLVGRWAEDQFLAILGGCQGTALPSVSGRIREMIAGGSIEWWGGTLAPGAVTLAGTSAQPEDCIESLLSRLQESLAAEGKSLGAAAGSTETGH